MYPRTEPLLAALATFWRSVSGTLGRWFSHAERVGLLYFGMGTP